MPKTKEQYNEYMRGYMKRRFDDRKALALSLLGGKCCKCGSVDQLEFDHVERDGKLRNMTEMSAYSEARFTKELEKCQLLCAECHWEKTLVDLGRMAGFWNHGTLASYRYCRCDLCRKAKNSWQMEYRKTHPRKKK
jgi:hypothetical protein